MGKGLKISFFGSSLVSAYWNGAATYYRGIISELNKRGHEITFYEPDAYDRQKHRDIKDPEYAESVIYEADEKGVKKSLSMAKGSDIIIKTSGVGINDVFLEKEVLNLQNADTAVIFWDVDAPATLNRIKMEPEDQFKKLISQYDMILTYGGGERAVSVYKEYGAKSCIPIYNALDPKTHYPVDSSSKFEGTLGFLGNRLPDREERVKEFFFKTASLMPHNLFILGGNGWESELNKYPNVRCVGHVYTYEHNYFNCSTLAVLNINRQSMADFGFSPPTRIFEAAGAGACIISDCWDGIELFLKPNEECLVARNGEEVVQIINALNIDIAQRIGAAARERILLEHTYSKRAEDVEMVLLNCKNHQEVVM